MELAVPSIPNVALLFDANLPKMEDCSSPLCHEAGHIFCKHRFDFDAHMLYYNGYFSSVEFFDFQVILHFLYCITHQKVPHNQSCRYVIVTGDGTFLRDAEKEWRSKKSRKRNGDFQHGRLEFGAGFVTSRDITIHIEHIRMPPYGWDKYSCQRQIIKCLNERYGQRAS